MDLYQPSQCLALEVLLAFLEDEVCPRHRPALRNLGQRHWPLGGEFEIICGAHGEVGEEFEVAHRVGAELEIADGQAVRGFAPKWPHVDGEDGFGKRHLEDCVAGLLVEGLEVLGHCLLLFGAQVSGNVRVAKSMYRWKNLRCLLLSSIC